MPSNLSPSREAVQAAMNAASRPSFSDDAAVMLAAAYAIDVAPLVEALRPFATWADAFPHDSDELLLGSGVNRDGSVITVGDLRRARAVLARSAEEPR